MTGAWPGRNRAPTSGWDCLPAPESRNGVRGRAPKGPDGGNPATSPRRCGHREREKGLRHGGGRWLAGCSEFLAAEADARGCLHLPDAEGPPPRVRMMWECHSVGTACHCHRQEVPAVIPGGSDGDHDCHGDGGPFWGLPGLHIAVPHPGFPLSFRAIPRRSRRPSFWECCRFFSGPGGQGALVGRGGILGTGLTERGRQQEFSPGDWPIESGLIERGGVEEYFP